MLGVGLLGQAVDPRVGLRPYDVVDDVSKLAEHL
jgi:hypothetical protein